MIRVLFWLVSLRTWVGRKNFVMASPMNPHFAVACWKFVWPRVVRYVRIVARKIFVKPFSRMMPIGVVSYLLSIRWVRDVVPLCCGKPLNPNYTIRGPSPSCRNKRVQPHICSEICKRLMPFVPRVSLRLVYRFLFVNQLMLNGSNGWIAWFPIAEVDRGQWIKNTSRQG